MSIDELLSGEYGRAKSGFAGLHGTVEDTTVAADGRMDGRGGGET